MFSQGRCCGNSAGKMAAWIAPSYLQSPKPAHEARMRRRAKRGLFVVGWRISRADYGVRAPRSWWLLLTRSSKLIPVSPELSQATGAHAPSNVKSPQSKVLINSAPALGAMHIAYQHSYDKHAFCLTRAAWCAPDYCLSREHALPRCGWHGCSGISITTSVHVRPTLAPSNHM